MRSMRRRCCSCCRSSSPPAAARLRRPSLRRSRCTGTGRGAPGLGVRAGDAAAADRAVRARSRRTRARRRPTTTARGSRTSRARATRCVYPGVRDVPYRAERRQASDPGRRGSRRRTSRRASRSLRSATHGAGGWSSTTRRCIGHRPRPRADLQPLPVRDHGSAAEPRAACRAHEDADPGRRQATRPSGRSARASS